MIDALCPPKPKLLDITTRSFRCRGSFGAYSDLIDERWHGPVRHHPDMLYLSHPAIHKQYGKSGTDALFVRWSNLAQMPFNELHRYWCQSPA